MRNGGTSGTATVGAEIELGANGAWSLLTAGTTTTIAGVISDGGNTFGFSTSGTRTMRLEGANTFDGDLTISSPVTVTGDNSARGGQNIFNGSSMTMTHDDALGSGKLVFNGGNLIVSTAADVTLSNTWEVNGQLRYGGSRTPTMTGALDPLEQDMFITAVTGGGSPRRINIDVNVTENGGFAPIDITVNAGGNGTRPRFNGDIIISGDITMRGTGGQAGAIVLNGDNSGTTGDLIIDGTISSTGVQLLSTTALTSGTFKMLGSANKLQLMDNGSTTVTILAGALEWGGTLDLDQENLRFTGNMLLSDDLSMQTGSANGILELAGVISDGGNAYGIEMDPDDTRTGRLILSGANTFTGGLIAEGGAGSGTAIIQLDGSIANADVAINTRGRLEGSGTIFFQNGDLITVSGTAALFNATSMEFDLTAPARRRVHDRRLHRRHVQHPGAAQQSPQRRVGRAKAGNCRSSARHCSPRNRSPSRARWAFSHSG